MWNVSGKSWAPAAPREDEREPARAQEQGETVVAARLAQAEAEMGREEGGGGRDVGDGKVEMVELHGMLR